MTNEKDMEEASDVDSASWYFMSVTEIDAPFIEKRERMKVLIGRRDNSIRAEAVKAERERCAAKAVIWFGRWIAEDHSGSTPDKDEDYLSRFIISDDQE